jgi:hypothetical protein
VTKRNTIEDLAQLLHKELVGEFACQSRIDPNSAPSLQTLTELIGVIFAASLKSEEAQPAIFSVLHVRPGFQLPSLSHTLTANTPWYVTFQDPIPFEVSNLVKLARATDPRSTGLAVYHNDEGGLFIWGLVDQEANWNDILNRDVDSGVAASCNFRIIVYGPGLIDVFVMFEKLASFQGDTIITEEVDVFSRGPILKNLRPGIKRYKRTVEKEIKRLVEAKAADEDLRPFPDTVKYWVDSLCRLLSRIRGFRHGGAILITPETTSDWLTLKYNLQYLRLRSALINHALTQSIYWKSHDVLIDEINGGRKRVAASTAHLQMVFRMRLEDSVKELDSCLWSIALLSRVDGLILLSQDLIVQGFGVEITCAEIPKNIVSSKSATPKLGHATPLTYTDYGTRHRSMMRYCYKVPGSIGFVISHDGVIRAITRVVDHLIVWENIRVMATGETEIIGEQETPSLATKGSPPPTP